MWAANDFKENNVDAEENVEKDRESKNGAQGDFNCAQRRMPTRGQLFQVAVIVENVRVDGQTGTQCSSHVLLTGHALKTLCRADVKTIGHRAVQRR